MHQEPGSAVEDGAALERRPGEAPAHSDGAAARGIEVFVECDPAFGPYSSQSWRDALEHARSGGYKIEKMQVDRRVI